MFRNIKFEGKWYLKVISISATINYELLGVKNFEGKLLPSLKYISFISNFNDKQIDIKGFTGPFIEVFGEKQLDTELRALFNKTGVEFFHEAAMSVTSFIKN